MSRNTFQVIENDASWPEVQQLAKSIYAWMKGKTVENECAKADPGRWDINISITPHLKIK